tara:strand:+ start:20450 stop:21520 length:1071 start_codon:yes stop_codon:yes gene_type:complete
MLLFAVLVIVGLVVLSYGADMFIKASVHMAVYFRVSAMIIGMTIVAFGTSAPEAAVSWISTYYGQAGIAVGNVVGSNLFNILVVLGITAIVKPLSVELKLLKAELPFMIVVTLLMLIFFLNGQLNNYEGACLLLLFVLFNVIQYFFSRLEKLPENGDLVEVERHELKLGKEALLFILGLILLVGGSRVFVYGAENLARILGISEVIIGLTIVSIGTSLPELAASLAAVRQKQADIAIGNVIGSNIYNICLVLGGSVFFTDTIPMAAQFFAQDMVVLTFTSCILLPILHTQMRMTKFEGMILVGLYLLYTFLLLSKTLQRNENIMWDLISIYMVAVMVLSILRLALDIRARFGSDKT